MFIDQEIPSSRLKLGWYEVNGKKYLNKYHALENCGENQWPTWNFNNDIYDQEDWTTEPKDSLYELYHFRALQLRLKYDNVILYYSGGVDSHVILNSFIRNNIPLDGIVVSGTFSLDRSLSQNCNIEQETVALPYLMNLKTNGLLKCPIYQLNTTELHKEFVDENWVYACGQSLTPQAYTYNYFWKDPWIQNILNRGKTCFIRGIDKPRVILEDNKWYFAFLDMSMLGGTPTGYLSKNQDWDIQEYFYWTPDCTSIVNKQAHILINWFEKNLSEQECRNLTSKEGSTFKPIVYNSYVDPLIYSKDIGQIPGGDKQYFSLFKPNNINLWHKDYWFFQSKDVLSKEFDVWKIGLEKLSTKIHPNKLNKITEKQILELNSVIKQDCLLLKNPRIISGTVGIWSKFFFIKEAEFSLA